MTDPIGQLAATDDLWRRRRWHRPAPEPPTRWGPEGAAALTLAYSYVINRVVPQAWYVPANLTAAAGFVALARGLGATWTDITANFPDIPANDILALNSGGLVVATDLGVLHRAAGETTWTRLGDSSLPVTVAMDLSLGPDGQLYVATHGRGIWRTSAAGL